MSEHQVEPHVFVIIGATGDLTRRKLLPALYHLRDQGTLETRNTLIVGAALPEMGEEGFRQWAFEGLSQGGSRNEAKLRVWCEECLHYQSLHEGRPQDYEALASYIRRLEFTHSMSENRVFYLALPPDTVLDAMESGVVSHEGARGTRDATLPLGGGGGRRVYESRSASRGALRDCLRLYIGAHLAVEVGPA